MIRVKSRGSSGLSSDTGRGGSLRMAESTERLVMLLLIVVWLVGVVMMLGFASTAVVMGEDTKNLCKSTTGREDRFHFLILDLVLEERAKPSSVRDAGLKNTSLSFGFGSE